MKTAHASGLQIAFLTFAYLLLVVPATGWLLALRPWPPETRALLEKAAIFVLAAALLFGIPPLRRACRRLLREPIAPQARVEVALATALKLIVPFAVVGGIALWLWIGGGPAALAHYVGQWQGEDRELARAFLVPHIAHMLLLAGVLGPIVEELVFRGFLYRAWERQWGWFLSLLLTSALFGAYHGTSLQAFLASIVFTCLYRRTGSLRAPIIAHMVGNVALWYPFLGRHLVPGSDETPGDLGAWGLQFACLVAAVVAIPAYLWIARRGPRDPFPATVPLGALPR